MKRSLTQLAKAVGCSSLDPIPPDQYLWMQNAGEPPLYRLWSWMVYQTMHWGRDSAYAITVEGHELHLKHAADDLEINEANIYKYWQEGVLRGLWRNGTRAEGAQRLYLNGTVSRQKGEEMAKQIVCKYNFPPHMLTLRPCILEQIQELTPERQREVFVRYGRIQDVGRMVHADLVAATRMVTDQDEDTLWRDMRIDKNRQEHKKAGASAEEIEERQRRIAAVLPEVKKYVDTITASVQSAEEADPSLYEARYKVEIADASLLMLNTSRRGQTVSRHEVSAVADASAPTKPLSKRARSSYTRSEQPSEPEPDRKIDPKTQEGLKLLAGQLEQMQKAYKHTDFGLSDFDPNSKPGQLFLLRVVTAAGGPGQVMSFCLYVATKFKGLDRNALGKLPPRAPDTPAGPRGLGLILSWAKDFGRSRAAAGGSGGEK